MSQKCHICLCDVGRMPHYHTCKPKSQDKSTFLLKQLNYNFPDLNYNLLYELYIIKNYSILDIINMYKKITSYQIYFLLKQYNIKKKGIAEANKSPNRQEKIKNTCLTKYGTTNVLSKNTKFYKKRNKTVKEKYGVDNVFQLEDVKKKSNNTMLLLYNRLRLTNSEKRKETIKNMPKDALKSWYSKLGTAQKNFWKNLTHEEKTKKVLNLLTGNNQYTKMNKLEEKIYNILTLLENINFSFGFFHKGKQFDFIIEDKILLEIK